MADFFPQALAKIKTWAANFKAKFTLHASAVGLAGEVATSDANCDALTAEINQVAIKKAEYESAVQAKNTSLTAKRNYWRGLANQIKSNPNYSPAMGEDLDIIGEDEELDLTTYKPGIEGQAFKGYNQLRFEKGHRLIDGVNVYGRPKGTTTWTKLAYDTNSPYPHYGPQQGDTWEYQLVGVIDDVEAGLPSLIVELTAI